MTQHCTRCLPCFLENIPNHLFLVVLWQGGRHEIFPLHCLHDLLQRYLVEISPGEKFLPGFVNASRDIALCQMQ